MNVSFSKLFVAFTLLCATAFGQTQPISRDYLHAKVTLLPPRYTTTQRDALTPTEGEIIYNTTTNRLETYEGSNWVSADGVINISGLPSTMGTAGQILVVNGTENGMDWDDANNHAHASSDITSGTLDAARLPDMVGDSGSGGTKGAVPAPASGDADKFLKGDGTWALPDIFNVAGMPTAIGTEGQVLKVNTTEDALEFGDLNDHAHAGDDITSGTVDNSYLGVMVGASSGAAGEKGAVPAPVAGEQLKFLRGDGTWASVTTGSMSALDMTDIPDAYGGAGTILQVNAGNTGFNFVNPNSLSLSGSQIVSGTVSASRLGLMTGATAGANGASGAVPAPTTGQHTHFLRGDGTWQSVGGASEMTGATALDPGTAGLAPAPGAGDQVTFLKGDGTWANPALGTDTSGNYVATGASGSGVALTGGGSEGATLTAALSALTENWSQTGAYDILLANADSELAILESTGDTYYGILDVGNLSANRTYTLGADESGVIVVAPTAGSSGQYLQSDGDGTYSWSSSSVDWTAPGTIGSGTPNSGAFTTLSASGDTDLGAHLAIGADASTTSSKVVFIGENSGETGSTSFIGLEGSVTATSAGTSSTSFTGLLGRVFTQGNGAKNGPLSSVVGVMELSQGSGVLADGRSIVGRLERNYTGTLTDYTAFEAEYTGSSGTVTNTYGIRINDLDGATSSVGLKIEDIAGASGTNDAIQTGTGAVRFGDSVYTTNDLNILESTGGTYYLTLDAGDLSANRTVSFRDAAGTVVLSGDTFTGDVTGTLDADGSTALTLATGAVSATQLAATSVVAGSYNGWFTVDDDGRLTGAGTLTKTFMLSAAGGTVPASGGAATPVQVNGTNLSYWTLDFDAATDEAAWWATPMPHDYDGGTVTVKVYWTSAGGNSGGTAYWTIAGRAFTDDDALDTAVGTAATGNDDWLANTDVHVCTLSTLTIAGTPTADKLTYFKLTRDADNASDDLTGDARVLYVTITYTPKKTSA
jgi:collagen type I/II/III/V/XI/XXIV/XXVII alpha